MDVMGYLVENALIMVPVLLVLGKFLKSIPQVPDWTIPLALLVPGVLGTMAMAGWTVDGAIQGILVTGVAVYGNQIWKQVQNTGD